MNERARLPRFEAALWTTALAATLACSMENPAFDPPHEEVGHEVGHEVGAETRADEQSTGDGEPSTEDGEGEGETGDGDGDPGTGDGDGDPSTGDGDGEAESSTGDGDGDLPCPIGLEDCNGQCVNLQFDAGNCGLCGVPCEGSQLCAQASCEPKKYVFVSKATPALLDGLAGADALCQQEAASAQLNGSFKAWLSNEFNSPSTTFSKQGVYVLRNGPVVAWSWEDLVDGQLLAPINRDVSGEPIEPNEACGFDFAVWTGTNYDGTSLAPHCAGWLLDNNLDHGRAGNAAATDSTWSATDCTPECGAHLGVYCVQQ